MQKPTLYHQVENTAGAIFATAIFNSEYPYEASLHFHKNYEYILVLEGFCQCRIDNDTFTLQKGEVVLIKPFSIHGIALSEGASVRCTTFHEHLIYTLVMALENKRALNPVFRLSGNTERYFTDALHTMFGDAAFTTKTLSPDNMLTVKACLYALSGEFLKSVRLIADDKNKAGVITDIVMYISQNFKSDISLRDIAKTKGYSYHYLSRTFNRILGISFKTLLNQYRIEYAVALIEDTHEPIGEIAFKSGFQNIHSFNEYCKLFYGKTPRQIRNSAKTQ